MRQLFYNLPIRVKLLSAFIVISGLVLASGIKQYFILKAIDEKKEYIVKSISVADALKQAKYYMRTHMHYLIEMLHSDNQKEAKEWWSKNAKISEEFESTNDFLIESSEQNQNDSLLSRTHDISHQIKNVYKTTIKPSFERAHRLKLDILNPTLSLSDLNLYISTTQDSSNFKKQFSIENKIEILQRQLSDVEDYLGRNGLEVINLLEETGKVTESMVTRSLEASNELASYSLKLSTTIIIIGLIVSIWIAIFVSNIISNPINQLREILYKLAKGELPETKISQSKDEIGDMSNALNLLVDGLRRTSEFSYEIGEGNFASNYSALSEKDVLGNSLLNMRDSLKFAKEEEEKHKVEDFQRNWMTEGLAKFSEILRRNTGNISELSNDIIKNLVKYLNANQGGIFIYNDNDANDIHLELIAAYAYNRKKYLQRKIKLGEGLVGAVAIEKYTICMTEIPEEYIEIESGIGSANPKSLLIVPLNIEQEVLGVIEVASFSEFHEHEIKLVEKIAESIASTLSTAKINTRTALLLEQSRLQTEEMQQQEEQMHQTIEELRATQEESQKREELIQKNLVELDYAHKSLADKDVMQQREIAELMVQNDSKIKEIREREAQSEMILETSLDAVIIINEKGMIEYFNKAAEKLWGYERSEVMGKNVKILMTSDYAREHDSYISNYVKTGTKKIIGKGREITIAKKNGTEGIAFLAVIEVKIAGVTKFTAFMKDFTEQKRIEEEQNTLLESVMAKEFEFKARIDKLKCILVDNKIEVPESNITDESLITWDAEYVFGIALIDQQHKKWVDMINKLYEAFKKGNAHKIINDYLKDVVDYTDYHFGFEEKYMMDFKFENFENHFTEHQKFVRQVKLFQTEYNAGKIDIAYKLMNYLKTWILNHIVKADRKYIECFRNNGLV